MKIKLYWGMLFLFGVLHLFIVSGALIPAFIIAALFTFILQKKMIIRIFSLDNTVNGLLLIIQIVLLLLQFHEASNWVYIIILLSFIIIEYIRLKLSHIFFFMKKEIAGFEEYRHQLNETFRIVRSERHDFLKHISALHYLLEKEQNNEARVYLTNLVDGYEETNLSIKGEQGSVAGILHQMYQRAKSANIEVVYDLEVPLSSLPLADKEIVTLVGNLLANSIEASEEWQTARGKQANITLQFYKKSGLFLLICKNNSLPIPVSILDQLYDSYGHTTKGDGHEGLGTKLIQNIVQDHQGFLDFTHKNEEFHVKIKIPAIR
ncbi:GHKL domain-containing protein [Robertmurraya sp. FSL W8-0741]|uniref:sensor histidine kinase n=1 Tax=Robertmurraya sp. FSL W8-0741 TaxID=2954629 RepID=UPI0030FC98B3